MPEQTRITTALVELRECFAARYGDRLRNLILYGSYARGNARLDSDVDVLVVLSGEVDPISEIAQTETDVANVSLRYDVALACYFVSEQEYARGQSPLLLSIRKEEITAEGVHAR